jgi:predicted AAA+ superfamily ATPase
MTLPRLGDSTYPYGVSSRKAATEFRRIFAFDTGLICWARGWQRVEQADLELLWKHLVLGNLRSSHPEARIYYYWHDRNTVTPTSTSSWKWRDSWSAWIVAGTPRVTENGVS